MYIRGAEKIVINFCLVKINQSVCIYKRFSLFVDHKLKSTKKFIAGFIAKSIAVQADAAHMLTDLMFGFFNWSYRRCRPFYENDRNFTNLSLKSIRVNIRSIRLKLLNDFITYWLKTRWNYKMAIKFPKIKNRLF